MRSHQSLISFHTNMRTLFIDIFIWRFKVFFKTLSKRISLPSSR